MQDNRDGVEKTSFKIFFGLRYVFNENPCAVLENPLDHSLHV